MTSNTQSVLKLKADLFDESDRMLRRFFILMRSTSRSVNEHNNGRV